MPFFIGVVLLDEIFEHEPRLDKEEIEYTYGTNQCHTILELYKVELRSEMTRYEQLMTPIIGKLQVAMHGDSLGYEQAQQHPAFYQQNEEEMEELYGDMGGQFNRGAH